MFPIKPILAVSYLAGVIHQSPYLSITQAERLDQEVKICIEQTAPLHVVEVEAKTVDQYGETWASHAFFKANQQGFIDVGTQAPLSGSSYETIDGMGLFWSMLPPSNDPSASFKCKDDRLIVELTVRQDGRVIAQETMTRFLKKPEVRRIEVRENGIVGALFLPPSEKPLPVIVTLGGSNGGLSENRAKLLASNDFAILALGYFGMEGLPSNLQEIPLEYFEKAFFWLKNQPHIDGSRIGLYGISRGAELVLILGSLFPDSIQAITAVVPSSVVHGGLSDTPVNAWMYQGKPLLPFASKPQIDLIDGKGQTSANPATTRQNFLEGMRNAHAYEAASIPVEKINCPLLLISAGDDQMWPSDVFTTQILERLNKYKSPIMRQHIHYPAAGHGINIPNLPIPGPVYYHPVGKLWLSMGGSRAADAAASSDSWTKLVAFFHQSFQEGDQ